MKRFFLLLLTFSSAFLSCKKDDETDILKAPLITITDLPWTDGDDYILVAGVDGEILNTTKIAEITEQPLYPKKKYNKDRINLLYISTNRYEGNKSFVVTAIANLNRGIKWSMGGTYNPNYIQSNITFTNVSEFSSLYTTAHGDQKLISKADEASKISFEYQKGSKLFFDLTRPSGRFYNLVDPEDSKMINVDIASINNPFQEKEHSFPFVTKGGFNMTGGFIGNGENRHFYFIGFNNISSNSNSVTIPFPGSAFNDYYSFTTLDVGDKTSYEMLTIGEIPSVFKKIDAQVTVSNWNPSNFKASFTGNLDKYKVVYLNPPHHATIEVHAQASSSKIKLPEFGPAIGEPTLQLKDFTQHSITLEEYEDYEENLSYFRFYNEKLFPYNLSKQLLIYKKGYGDVYSVKSSERISSTEALRYSAPPSSLDLNK